jgi:hypothetical protein
MISLDVLRRMLTKDSVYWPITLAKHSNNAVQQTQNSGNESTLFFSYHEFCKGLEIIMAQYLKDQNKTAQGGASGVYRPSKEDVQREVEKLTSRIIANYNKAKSKGFFKLNPPG